MNRSKETKTRIGRVGKSGKNGRSDDIQRMRAIAMSASLQFSPQMQPIRERTLDGIVVQTLFVANRAAGLTEQEIHNYSSCGIAYTQPALKAADVHNSLMRLLEQGRILPAPEGERALQLPGPSTPRLTRVVKLSKHAHTEVKDRFVLAPHAHAEQQQAWSEYEARVQRMLKSLFKHAPGGPELYHAPFMDALCRIFAKLGATNVRLLSGEAANADSVLGLSEWVRRVVARTLKGHPSLDVPSFESAVDAFLRGSDPDYKVIMWHLAQSYFMAGALGLDARSGLLSEALFSDTTFLLDTNVVLAAVEPEDSYNTSFLALSEACRQLGIKLKVCRVSLDELDTLASYHESLLRKVEDQIPVGLYDSVGGMFFQMYRHEKEARGSVNFEHLFSNMHNAEAILTEKLGIEVIDEPWFSQEVSTPQTEQYALVLAQAYKEKTGKEKKPHAARHDALLVRWLLEQRQSTNNDIRILTVDTSLPTFSPPGRTSPKPPLALGLSALLQWVSTIKISSTDDEAVAQVFAEIVKLDLLPRERLLEVQDFRLLDDMGLRCANLPAEDVRGLIAELREAAAHRDPANPRDLQHLSYVAQKYLSDPSRMHSQEVARLTAVLESRDEEFEHERRLNEEERLRLQTQIGEYQKKQDDEALDKQKGDLRSRALRKFWLAGVGIILSEVLWLWLYTTVLTTTTWWPKLITDVVGMLVILVASLILYTVVVPTEEREALDFDPAKLISIVTGSGK